MKKLKQSIGVLMVIIMLLSTGISVFAQGLQNELNFEKHLEPDQTNNNFDNAIKLQSEEAEESEEVEEREELEEPDEAEEPQEHRVSMLDIIEVVVPAIWIPVDKNSNEILSYLAPIPTIPSMYPRSEVAKLDDNDKYMIDYMGVPKPEPDGWSANHFMYTANLFFRDRFHRVVAQGRDERNFDEEISAVRKLEYGTFSDEAVFNGVTGKYTGLHGMTKTEYQPGQIMKLYIATETEDTSLSEAIFGEETLEIIYDKDDATTLMDLYNNIKEAKFKDFDNWAQETTLDGTNDQQGLRERLDTIYLFQYDSPDSDSGSFITEGDGYRDFVVNGFADLEPGKYEVVFPIYWGRNVPEYMSAPDVFSRNRYLVLSQEIGEAKLVLMNLSKVNSLTSCNSISSSISSKYLAS